MKRLRKYFAPLKSLPPRGAWIEMCLPAAQKGDPVQSLPPRGAWIEIPAGATKPYGLEVAPPTGSVD